MIGILLLLADASVSLPDPAIVAALSQYGDCFRQQVRKSAPKLAERQPAYAAAETACSSVRANSASVIEERWRARSEPANPKLTGDRYVGYYLAGVQYELDVEIIGRRWK